MIDSGIVIKVQTTPAVLAIAKHGGYAGALPKDPIYPTWRYIVVSDDPNTGLLFTKGLRTRYLQIDCYGETDLDAVHLAKAIDNVLDGFAGTLPDTDNTFVSFCVNANKGEGPEEDTFRRNFRRRLEYEILYAQD